MMLVAQGAAAATVPSYKILFCIYSWYYFRHMRPMIQLLAKQGHTIHVVSIIHDRDDFKTAVDEVCGSHPNVTYQIGPERQDEWAERAAILRQTQCFIQSQDARFDSACRYGDTARLKRRYPEILDRPFLKTSLGRELAWRALRRCNDALPTAPEIDGVFVSFKPDVMVITPLIDRLGGMWDYMASAREAGVRTVFPVHSWDNLSSKARTIHFPDRALVWNEIQVEEAVNFHHIPRGRIFVTGAQGFDEWFAMTPSTTREAFCRELGFDPRRPILLYVCSAILKRHMAPGIASDKTELAYFSRWISALRNSPDLRLREANIIIRPHPKRERQWDDVDLSALEPVVVHPRKGRLPNDQASKAVFFDSIYHSAAVVGINTSAMIEAGIIGRPVMTIFDSDYAAGQVEMQHFQYLLKVGDGLLITAETYEDHVQQIGELLNDPVATARRVAAFTETFVRPLGCDRAATPIAVQAILDVAKWGPAKPKRRGLLGRWLEHWLARWTPVSRVTPQDWSDLPKHELKRRLARREARRASRAKQHVDSNAELENTK